MELRKFNVLAIDLASRFSAGIVMDLEGNVIHEFDSWKYDQLSFVKYCVDVAESYGAGLVMIEDLPYGLSSQVQTKPVTRMQGMFIQEFNRRSIGNRLFFVDPASWQRGLGIFRAGKEAPREKAQELGFEKRLPVQMYEEDIPPLGKEHAKERSKVRTQLNKASTDYDDAFLIASWVVSKIKDNTLKDVKGVQQHKG